MSTIHSYNLFIFYNVIINFSLGGKPFVKIYNKLVRDKIPSIIEKDNKTCKCRILDDKEYLESLNTKLKEELDEYLSDESIMELCDIEEIILAIINAKGLTYDEFEKMRKEKAYQRGAFDKKIFLISVDNKESK